jgi:hypothetical protein
MNALKRSEKASFFVLIAIFYLLPVQIDAPNGIGASVAQIRHLPHAAPTPVAVIIEFRGILLECDADALAVSDMRTAFPAGIFRYRNHSIPHSFL